MNETGGSFGIPQNILDAVDSSKKKAKGKNTEETKEPEMAFFDSETIPEVEESPQEEVPEKDAEVKEPKVSVEEQIAVIKKELGIEIDEDDLWKVFMGEQLEKSGIVVIPGKLEVTFKTHSLTTTQSIDQKMAEALELKFLEAGYRNLQTQYLLSEGIVGLGKPGKARQLGSTSEERFEQLGKMSTLLVERLAHRWNQFTWLVNEIVNKEMDSGKS